MKEVYEMTRNEFLKVSMVFAAAVLGLDPAEMLLADDVRGRRVFKDDWDYLKRKWREPCANPATGLGCEAFQAALENLVAERKPLDSWSVVKAKVFALGCDRAAIGVSGHDWRDKKKT